MLFPHPPRLLLSQYAFARTHWCTWHGRGERSWRGTGSEKCLTQEHNSVILTRVRTQTARSVILCTITLPVDSDTHEFFATFRVTFLMPPVCFKAESRGTLKRITWGHFSACVVPWLLRITCYMFIHNMSSSRGKLTVGFPCHRTVSMTAVYHLKIKYIQDKFGGFFRRKTPGKLSSWR